MKAVVWNNIKYDKTLIVEKLEKGFEMMGGIDKYFSSPDNVLLKPNLLAAEDPENAVTTHPVILESILEVFSKHSIKCGVGDSPAVATSLRAAKKSGLLAVCEKMNVPFIELKTEKIITRTENPFVKSFEIAEEITEYNKIVSLPKLKNHSLTIFTGGMKNLFGIIPGKKKAYLHTRFFQVDQFANMIVDLVDTVNTGFCIMDGILAHQGHGPRGGEPVELNTLIMGEHPFITDLIGSYIAGYNPEDIPIIKHYARKHGLKLGIADHSLLGDKPVIHREFKRLPVEKKSMIAMNAEKSWIFKNLILSRPKIVPKKCIRCGQCIDICPTNPKSINFGESKYPEYNYNSCIRCFCCQEICPEKAIKIIHPVGAKILRGI